MSDHLRRVVNWSAQVRTFNVPAAKDVETGTVPLTFSDTPRRYQGISNRGQIFSEDDLLQSAKHLVILGPPGAGKTTTLKRIARLLLTEAPKGPLDTYQAPFLLRLREFNISEDSKYPLLTVIARELGLEVQTPEVRIKSSKKAPDGTTVEEETVKRGPPLCEERPIQAIIPKIINQLNPVLLVDGLDEVSTAARDSIEADIVLLLENCDTYKVIVTCRSGEYHTPIEYTTAIEVCDLQDGDVTALAGRWLGSRATEFLDKVRKPAFNELSRRPLFLDELLKIFFTDGTLPEHPFEMYEQLVRLTIREWDSERGVQRRSRYASFGPDKKLRFLASLAYHLTYVRCIKVFSEATLIEIYARIRKQFDLPAHEAELVATELESHTGIIAESGSRGYEFSHLTLQEYLCGEHLAKSPFPQDGISRLLLEYPAPLALATALSSDPAGWLAGVLLNDAFIDSNNEKLQNNLDTFLRRLETENPAFTNGEVLGYCVLALCFMVKTTTSTEGRKRIQAYIDRLVAHSAARSSFVHVITDRYSITMDDANHDFYVARRRTEVEIPNQPLPPTAARRWTREEGFISRAWLEQALSGDLLFGGLRVGRRR